LGNSHRMVEASTCFVSCLLPIDLRLATRQIQSARSIPSHFTSLIRKPSHMAISFSFLIFSPSLVSLARTPDVGQCACRPVGMRADEIGYAFSTLSKYFVSATVVEMCEAATHLRGDYL
jgi:hypothetical protein